MVMAYVDEIRFSQHSFRHPSWCFCSIWCKKTDVAVVGLEWSLDTLQLQFQLYFSNCAEDKKVKFTFLKELIVAIEVTLGNFFHQKC